MPVADRWEDGDEQVPGVDPTDTVNWPLCAYAAREGRGIMNRYRLHLIALAIGVAVLATPPVAAYPAPAGRLAPVTIPGVYRPDTPPTQAAASTTATMTSTPATTGTVTATAPASTTATQSTSQSTVTIPAGQPWTDTGMDLSAGQEVTITASGVIYTGRYSACVQCGAQERHEQPDGEPGDTPNNVMPLGPSFSLIGRIG